MPRRSSDPCSLDRDVGDRERQSKARELLRHAQFNKEIKYEVDRCRMAKKGRQDHRGVQEAANAALESAASLEKLRDVLSYDGWLASEHARERARAQLRRAAQAAAKFEQLDRLPGAWGWGTGRFESSWSGKYEDMVARVEAEHSGRARAAEARWSAVRDAAAGCAAACVRACVAEIMLSA